MAIVTSADIATYIGTGVTLVATLCSLISWKKTKNYYHKIMLVEDVENVDKAIDSIESCKELYNQIVMLLGEERGVKGTGTIKKKFMAMKKNLQNIESVVPSKYLQIHKLCTSPIEYTDNVISGRYECINDSSFRVFQFNITNIQKELKSSKDEIRGIK